MVGAWSWHGHGRSVGVRGDLVVREIGCPGHDTLHSSSADKGKGTVTSCLVCVTSAATGEVNERRYVALAKLH